MLKSVVRSILNKMGYDIVQYKNSPQKTLLGLAKRPIKVVIDVGANEGQFAKFIAARFPASQLYCFEPLPNAYQKIKAWAESNPPGRINVFNMAIGDSEGVLDMFYHAEHSASSSLLQTTDLTGTLYPLTKEQQCIKVRLSTLDDALVHVFDDLLPEILIKLDVQGYEDRVIRGGGKIFGKAKAVILEVNLDLLYQQQATFNELIMMLDDLGYSYAGNFDQAYGDDGHVVFCDAVFLNRNA